jgi:hypothetical protein
MTYVRPYGRAEGLATRLEEWRERLCSTAAPWFGLGLMDDLQMAAQLLNLPEFVDWLRVHGDPAHSHFADEIAADRETLEAVSDALHEAGRGRGEDPVLGVESLHREVCQVDDIRAVLVRCGALAADDNTTPLPSLIAALLS